MVDLVEADMRQTIARSIERGLNGDNNGAELARRVAAAVACARLHPAGIEALRRLLYALSFYDSKQQSLLDTPQTMQGLAFLAACRERWIRPINHVNITFAASERVRFHALASYLLCQYPVPHNFVDAWLDADEMERQGPALAHARRRWRQPSPKTRA